MGNRFELSFNFAVHVRFFAFLLFCFFAFHFFISFFFSDGNTNLVLPSELESRGKAVITANGTDSKLGCKRSDPRTQSDKYSSTLLSISSSLFTHSHIRN